MNKKTVSIVIPHYNATMFIPELLESIRKQTYKEYCEVIVIENGSKPESVIQLDKIIDEYSKKLNIKYIKEGPIGVAKARNIGIENSTGDYITFIDNDDTLAGRYSIEYRVDYLENNDIDVVAGYALKMNEASTIEYSRAPVEVENLYRLAVEKPEKIREIYYDYYINHKKLFFFITGSALINNKKLKESKILFDSYYDRVDDVAFNIDLFENEFKFSLQKLPFYIKRSHGSNLSINTPEESDTKIIHKIKETYKYELKA